MTYILGFLLVSFVFQTIFSWLQIKRIYHTIHKIKSEHKGESCYLATGTGKRKFISFSRGIFLILLVNDSDQIVDYHEMEGFTVFSSPKRVEEYIGKSTEDVCNLIKRRKKRTAFISAMKQIEQLRSSVTCTT